MRLRFIGGELMKLSYRGASYDYNPPILDMGETGVVGKYRGQSYAFTYPRHVPVPQPAFELKYRGVAHRTKGSAVAAPVMAASTVEEVTPRVETNMSGRATNAVVAARLGSANAVRQSVLSEVAKAHRNNIQRALQHRIQVAKARGDENLLNQLESELQQMA